MKVLPMVVIPGNFPEYTSRRVHVAEWIDGEKLSQSKADDVGALVNLGVITYLTQLLDKGFFHADPVRSTITFNEQRVQQYQRTVYSQFTSSLIF
jgi:predicted unusual protein kinase regulating ubiquinone biosynthesis (AarF/ABC1/UbiB family)